MLIEKNVKPGIKSYKIDHTRLRAWRHEQGLTQPQLAKRLGVGDSAVQGWERNIRGISESSLIKWRETFNFDPRDRFGLERHPHRVASNNGRLGVKVNGKQFRLWRLEMGFTQKQLAKEIGVWNIAISNWEVEKKKISFKSRTQFSKRFGFDPAIVFRHKEVTDKELFLGGNYDRHRLAG